jgi:hypothetical protein
MSAMDGVWVWVWNLERCEGADPARIAARLQQAGAAGVIVKITDGARRFGGGAADARRLADAGVPVATWSYCYGTADEAQAIAAEVARARPLWHVLDVEQEVEQSPDPAGWARGVVAALRPLGVPLAYCPLPVPRYHERLPYYQLSVEAGLPMVPMLYWVGLNWSVDRTVDAFVQDVARYGLGGPAICPAYEDCPLAGAGATDADVARFGEIARQQGWTGLSCWTWEHMDEGAWQRLARLAAALTPQPQPQPAPQPGPGDGSKRLQAARIGAALVSVALDEGLADDEALAQIDQEERALYALLYGEGAS